MRSETFCNLAEKFNAEIRSCIIIGKSKNFKLLSFEYELTYVEYEELVNSLEKTEDSFTLKIQLSKRQVADTKGSKITFIFIFLEAGFKTLGFYVWNGENLIQKPLLFDGEKISKGFGGVIIGSPDGTVIDCEGYESLFKEGDAEIEINITYGADEIIASILN